jgi:hypothetical protein
MGTWHASGRAGKEDLAQERRRGAALEGRPGRIMKEVEAEARAQIQPNNSWIWQVIIYNLKQKTAS